MASNKRVYFLSDFHLGAKYFSDAKAAEKRVVGFLDTIKNDASEMTAEEIYESISQLNVNALIPPIFSPRK